MGAYEDALKTLTEFDKKLAAVKRESNLSTVAFIAMALHQIGRAEEAKETLDRLRTLLKDERRAHFAQSDEGKALLAEAEKLILGEKQ